MTTRIISTSLVALVGASLPFVAPGPATADTRSSTQPAPVHQLADPQIIGHRGPRRLGVLTRCDRVVVVGGGDIAP